MIFQKRVSEPSQEMEGIKEARNYLLSHKRDKKKTNPYDYFSQIISKEIKLKKANVLDVGCGYGGLINSLKKYKPQFNFSGIDLSKAMITLAKNYVKEANFYLMPADKMSFKDNSFDLIICKDTFHHFSNPLKVINEMLRVLKEGGKIFITDLNRNVSEEVFYSVLQQLSKNNLVNATQYYDSVKASYTINEIKSLLKKLKIRKYKICPSTKLNGFNLDNYINGHWTLIISK